MYAAMTHPLEDYICRKIGERPVGLDLVLAQFTELRIKRNHVLLEEGKICHRCYFVVEGCLRLVTYNRNGEESTSNLIFEQEWVTSIQSFVNRQPANERIQALESSQLYAISFDAFQHLVKTVPPFETIYRALLEESYVHSTQRVMSLLGMDALERVRWLLSFQPLIFSRLSNKVIASYLGLSPETLSRLKMKL